MVIVEVGSRKVANNLSKEVIQFVVVPDSEELVQLAKKNVFPLVTVNKYLIFLELCQSGLHCYYRKMPAAVSKLSFSNAAIILLSVVCPAQKSGKRLVEFLS